MNHVKEPTILICPSCVKAEILFLIVFGELLSLLLENVFLCAVRTFPSASWKILTRSMSSQLWWRVQQLFETISVLQQSYVHIWRVPCPFNGSVQFDLENNYLILQNQKTVLTKIAIFLYEFRLLKKLETLFQVAFDKLLNKLHSQTYPLLCKISPHCYKL